VEFVLVVGLDNLQFVAELFHLLVPGGVNWGLNNRPLEMWVILRRYDRALNEPRHPGMHVGQGRPQIAMLVCGIPKQRFQLRYPVLVMGKVIGNNVPVLLLLVELGLPVIDIPPRRG
jgi:hypothetical protein